MPSVVFLRPRDSSSDTDQSSFGPIYIIGISVVGAILLGVCTWLLLRLYRKRVRTKRDNDRGAAFLSVKGLVKDDGTSPSDPAMFSRDNIIGPGIVMPDKALLKAPALSADEIVNHHRQSGTFPKPFAFAMNAGNFGPVDAPPSRPASFAGSIYSTISQGNSNRLSNLLAPPSPTRSQHRFSVLSVSSSNASSSFTSGHPRKVRQMYTPVLPDEITISLSEQLTVVESFDDGWCLVGREKSIFSSAPKSLFGNKPTATSSSDDVELGVVPAWVFIKPAKGLKAERPIRSTSLGITVQIDGPGGAENRGGVMSWSNF